MGKNRGLTCYPVPDIKKRFKDYCDKKRRSMSKQMIILIEEVLGVRKNPNGAKK